MVKEIELTQDQVALVDDEMFDFLNQWKWCASYYKWSDEYYAERAQNIGMFNGKQKQKKIRMHRAIIGHVLGRELKRSEIIDHINHNPLDNRLDNLRIVSNRQNSQNRSDNTSSKYPGVYWHKQHKKWRAEIRIGQKRKHLGYFIDEHEAAKAYERACRELCGEELVCKSESEGTE